MFSKKTKIRTGHRKFYSNDPPHPPETITAQGVEMTIDHAVNIIQSDLLAFPPKLVPSGVAREQTFEEISKSGNPHRLFRAIFQNPKRFQELLDHPPPEFEELFNTWISVHTSNRLAANSEKQNLSYTRRMRSFFNITGTGAIGTSLKSVKKKLRSHMEAMINRNEIDLQLITTEQIKNHRMYATIEILAHVYLPGMMHSQTLLGIMAGLDTRYVHDHSTQEPACVTEKALDRILLSTPFAKVMENLPLPFNDYAPVKEIRELLESFCPSDGDVKMED